MKTEQEINAGILEITITIRTTYPDLSKFLEETPVTIPYTAAPVFNIIHLMGYYD